jgi:predicted nucleic acid-binding protein
MTVVVDTSVIVAVIANEPEKAKLIRQTTGATLLAPASCHWEVGNAFSAMLRRRRITLAQAIRALGAYEQIPVRFVEADLVRSLELAAQFGIYAYDAYVIECALSRKSPLLTLDGGLAKAAREAGAALLEEGV